MQVDWRFTSSFNCDVISKIFMRGKHSSTSKGKQAAFTHFVDLNETSGDSTIDDERIYLERKRDNSLDTNEFVVRFSTIASRSWSPLGDDIERSDVPI